MRLGALSRVALLLLPLVGASAFRCDANDGRTSCDPVGGGCTGSSGLLNVHAHLFLDCAVDSNGALHAILDSNDKTTVYRASTEFGFEVVATFESVFAVGFARTGTSLVVVGSTSPNACDAGAGTLFFPLDGSKPYTAAAAELGHLCNKGMPLRLGEVIDETTQILRDGGEVPQGASTIVWMILDRFGGPSNGLPQEMCVAVEGLVEWLYVTSSRWYQPNDVGHRSRTQIRSVVDALSAVLRSADACFAENPIIARIATFVAAMQEPSRLPTPDLSGRITEVSDALEGVCAPPTAESILGVADVNGTGILDVLIEMILRAWRWMLSLVFDLCTVTTPLKMVDVESPAHSQIVSQTELLDRFCTDNPSQRRVCATARVVVSDVDDMVKVKESEVDRDVADVIRSVANVTNRTFGHYPWCSQLIAVTQHIMKSDDGSSVATQVATGHGKSVIIAMVVASASLLKNHGFPERFHVLTTTDYLAERDALEFSAFYKEFGLVSCSVVSDGSCIGADVVYSTQIRLSSAYLAGLCHDMPSLFRFDASKHLRHWLLADESDAFYIDNAAHGFVTRKTEGTPGVRLFRSLMIGMNMWLEVFMPVDHPNGTVSARFPRSPAAYDATFRAAMGGKWREGSTPLQTEMETLLFPSEGTFLNFFCNALRNVTTDESDLFRELYWSMPTSMKDDARHEFDRWCKSLRTTRRLRRGYEYCVQGGKNKIVPYDTSIGSLMKETVWKDGLDGFLRIQNGQPFEGPVAAHCSWSLFGFLDSYSSLSALSGTIGSEVECNILKEVYNVDCVWIPSRFERAERRLDPVLTSDFVEEVLKSAARAQKDHQPVLIVVEYLPSVDRLVLAFASDGRFKSTRLVNASEASNLPSTPLDSNVVIVATRAASRGVDLKLGPSAARTGLHVVVGDIGHYRNNNQTIGRGCRAGAPCSVQFIIECDSRACAGSFDEEALRQQERAQDLLKTLSGVRKTHKGEDEVVHSAISNSKDVDSHGNFPSLQLQMVRRDAENRKHRSSGAVVVPNLYLFQRALLWDAVRYNDPLVEERIPSIYHEDLKFMVGTALHLCAQKQFSQCTAAFRRLEYGKDVHEREYQSLGSTAAGELLSQMQAERRLYGAMIHWMQEQVIDRIKTFEGGGYTLSVSHPSEGSVFRLAGADHLAQQFAAQLQIENVHILPDFILTKKRSKWFLEFGLALLAGVVGYTLLQVSPLIGKVLIKAALSSILNTLQSTHGAGAGLPTMGIDSKSVVNLPLLSLQGIILEGLGRVVMPRALAPGAVVTEGASMAMLKETVTHWTAGTVGWVALGTTAEYLLVETLTDANSIVEKGISSCISKLAGLFMYEQQSLTPMIDEVWDVMRREMLGSRPSGTLGVLASAIPVVNAVQGVGDDADGWVRIFSRAVHNTMRRRDIDVSAKINERHGLHLTESEIEAFLTAQEPNFDMLGGKPISEDSKLVLTSYYDGFRRWLGEIKKDMATKLVDESKVSMGERASRIVQSMYSWYLDSETSTPQEENDAAAVELADTRHDDAAQVA